MRKHITSTILAVLLLCATLSFAGTVAAVPPQTPHQMEGPTSGNINVEYDYLIRGVADFDGDGIEYFVDWGDNTTSGWIGPYEAFEDITIAHTWTEYGRYEVTVKARDDNDTMSTETDWSEPLQVNIDMIEIVGVTGGAGVTIALKNNAEVSKNVNWNVRLIGGTFPGFHLNKAYGSDDDPLHLGPGETKQFTVSPSLALGRFKIEVEATAAGAAHPAQETYSALILFFYVIM